MSLISKPSLGSLSSCAIAGPLQNSDPAGVVRERLMFRRVLCFGFVPSAAISPPGAHPFEIDKLLFWFLDFQALMQG